MLLNQDYAHCTHKCTTPILGVGIPTCFSFKIHPKIFYSYTRRNTKNIFSIHPITPLPPNKAPMFLLLFLKNSVAEKRHVAMQKLF
jgi:hypothetical protein